MAVNTILGEQEEQPNFDNTRLNRTKLWRGGGGQSVSTPQWFFDAINHIWNFKLDVAADTHNAKCHWFFSELEDGLLQPWSKRNWCNPPYNNVGPWLQKADEEAKRCNVTVMLIPMKTECKYWRLLINNPRVSCLAMNKKIAFEGYETAFPLALCLLVFHPVDYKAPLGAKVALSKLELHPWGGASLEEAPLKRERVTVDCEYGCDYCAAHIFDHEESLTVKNGVVYDTRTGEPVQCWNCGEVVTQDMDYTEAA